MKLNIKKLLDFFDGKVDSHNGDANAVISMLGEDLNAGVYKHYKKNKVVILAGSVLPGGKIGQRLDRWILDDKNKILFQCEIKNWAATAIGGRELKSDANELKTKEIVDYYWRRELNGNLAKSKDTNSVTKVLLHMKVPDKYKKYKVQPLLIYWMPISNNNLEPLFSISRLPIKTEFKKLYIFSVSLYLRSLFKKGIKHIDLDLPNFKNRINILNGFKLS